MHKKSVNISPVDTVFVNGSYPIEMLFYYKNRINGSAIHNALKMSTKIFWPLFGRYENGAIYSEKFRENDFFNETILRENFQADEDSADIWGKYSQVNPQPLCGLFFLSVIQFNNGTVIIPKMNHLVGDGYSYFYFLGMLAALAKKSFIPFRRQTIRTLAAPHHNRTVLKHFQFIKTEIEQALIYTDCTIHFVEIPKKSVKEQIKKISTEMNESVSTNDILSAMVVINSLQTQAKNFREELTLSIPIDIRRQVKEYGSKFFGNGILFHHLHIDFKKSPKADPGSLAVKIRKSMPQVDMGSYFQFLEQLEREIADSTIHSLKPYDPEKGCLVTNLSRMPSAKLNFGTGNPDFFFPLTIGKNSAAIISDKDNFILRLFY